jgi:hypothetical protein
LPFLLPFHLHTFWMVACPTSRYKFFSNPSNSSISIWSSFFLSPFCLSFTSTILADRLTMASVGWLVAVSLPPPSLVAVCVWRWQAGRCVKVSRIRQKQQIWPSTKAPKHHLPITPSQLVVLVAVAGNPEQPRHSFNL